MRGKFRKPTYAEIVATLALFIALGGISYAAIKIPNNSVGTKQLKKSAVNSAKVRDRSLLAKDFRKGQIPHGATGAQGAPGMIGPTGAAGATGASGIPGAVGATGPTGAAGVTGENGDPGQPGGAGPTGPTGVTGPSTTAVSSGVVVNLGLGPDYFPISGASSPQGAPDTVASLSPGVPVTASNLDVKLTAAPFAGFPRIVSLLDDGIAVLSCVIASGTTCHADTSALIDPGSELVMVSSVLAFPSITTARFGFTLGP